VLFRPTTYMLLLLALPALSSAEDNDGYALIRKHCYSCHGASFNGSAEFDLNDIEGLKKDRPRPYIKLDAPAEESYIWQRIESGGMPPDSEISDAEKEVIRAWIEAGAPQPIERKVVVKTNASVQSQVIEDLARLDQTDPNDVAFQRYFSLHHVYNNPKVSKLELRLYRAALSKVVNSLSESERIILPQGIDEEQTLFRVDLRDLGWHEPGLWNALLGRYPYGVHYENVENDKELREHARRLSKLIGTDIGIIRADWFVVSASQGELYDRFMKTPNADTALEQRLGVNVVENFLASPAKLMRAGFDESGVSTGARVVERHSLGRGGYYWKSYDFKPGNQRSLLYRFALGPALAENPFEKFAFRHDGGEIIYSLRNGLQGYMLTNENGDKIQEGPIKVVRDTKEIGGTPEVANAISCMHCHQHGMIRFTDSVRNSTGLKGRARDKVRELYADETEMNEVLEKDSARFLRALESAIGPFLQVQEHKDKHIIEFAEPVGAVAKFYRRDLDLDDAAFELGLSAERLQDEIERNDDLQFLGLGPLARGRKINRASWESKEFHVSPYQLAAKILKLADFVIEY